MPIMSGKDVPTAAGKDKAKGAAAENVEEEGKVQSYVDLTMTGEEMEQRRREEEKIKGAFAQAETMMKAMEEAGVEKSAIAQLQKALKSASRETEKTIEIKVLRKSIA